MALLCDSQALKDDGISLAQKSVYGYSAERNERGVYTVY